MKGGIGGHHEFARALHGDRFHVEEMRKLARQPQHADDGGMVEEFEALSVEPRSHHPQAEAFVRDFEHFEQEPQDPMEEAYMRAFDNVAQQFPDMPEALVHQRAAEMLHQMPMQDDPWVHEFAQRSRPHDRDVDMFLAQRNVRSGDPWAREMRMHEAFEDRERERMVSEYNRADFDGLDQAYESEMWAQEHLAREGQKLDEEKAKQEKDSDPWFDEFLRNENALRENSLKQITARLTAIDDPKLQQSQFMSFVRDLDSGRAVIEGNNLVRKDVGHDTRGKGDWVEEYAKMRQGPDFTEEDEAAFLERMYLDGQLELPDADMEWAGPNPSAYSVVRNDAYVFETPPAENRFSDHRDPLQEGMKLFRDGRFAEAILAFEAAVSRDPQSSQGWHYLGKSHQEGDKDSQASAALLKAVEVAPSNVDAYVDLAVSQVNNMQKDRAMVALENWLRHNPKYSHLTPPPLEEFTSGKDVDTQLRAMYERQDVLIDCFVEAAQMRPDDVDPSVQICLGLLYSLALEYDNAAQCFSAALTKMPDDYALWNKLGATLANSGRSEEALQAYFQALERKPLYVRARANLGISFLAMKLYPEAAKQFLSALSLEPDATHIWTNLETVFSYLQRSDLLAKARSRNVDDFRRDFDF